MARVLIAWELGEAFGHLARCLRLAHGLVQRGHTAVLALKDVRLPTGSDIPRGITVLPAPLTPQRRPAAGQMPVNFADVLIHCGFADPQDLAARLVAWQGMVSLVRPDVLVADHAPTALLAAHLAGLPHRAIGNGFTIPPTVSPWPSIRPWEAIAEERLAAAELRLDQVTETAQKALGYRAPGAMRDLFGADDILDTFAELDHYGERPEGRYVGPVVSVPSALRVPWQGREGAKVLAYLRRDVPGFPTILQGLARLDAEVLCVAPGLEPDRARRFATRRLRLALAPVDLPPLLAEADLAVGYGNSGFSTQALLAGVPLLMRPRHVEQALFASRVEAVGAGKILEDRADVETVVRRLQALLESTDHRRAAQAFGNHYRHFLPEQAIEQTLALVEQALLGAPRGGRERPATESQEHSPACLH